MYTPFLWKVTGNGLNKPAYLFGTLHVAYTRVWDYIPPIVKHKFRESDNVFFELDLLEPSVSNGMDDCKYLPHGQQLSSILPRDLYLRLVDHLKHVRFMMPKWILPKNRHSRDEASSLFRAKTSQWKRKHAIWTLLMIDSLTESQIRSHGTPTLDYYLAQEAQRMGKKTGAVENVEDQCEPLNNLNLSHVIFALNMSLFNHENIRRGLVLETQRYEALLEKYKCGNIDMLMSQEQMPSKDDALMSGQIEEYFREKFIKNRNPKMVKRIMSLLKEHPSEAYFFAFGVAHFIGNGSIIDLLKAHGYQIERVNNSRISSIHENRHQIRSRVNLLRRDETLITRMEPISRLDSYKIIVRNEEEPTVEQTNPLINWLMLACLFIMCIFVILQARR
uniref:Metalloprotease TIKI homolog n=2 Tax=Tetranychus urticae TaxID=32264 RepID=T1JSH8_TETUR